MLNNRVYDLIDVKSFAEVRSKILDYLAREKVKEVCIDLNPSFRSIARKYFPNAQIMTDYFHVIRMILCHFMEFTKEMQESIKWNRPFVRALRTKQSNLKPNQPELLNELFA